MQIKNPALWLYLRWHVVTAAAAALTLPAVATGQWVELVAGVHRIRAESAADAGSRARGLMFRARLPANQGMLFVFDAPGRHCMWMRDTLIPLSVAFLDASGRIINIEEMQAGTDDTHCAARPASFALEMNAGWFKTRSLRPGTVISGIEQAGPPR